MSTGFFVFGVLFLEDFFAVPLTFAFVFFMLTARLHQKLSASSRFRLQPRGAIFFSSSDLTRSLHAASARSCDVKQSFTQKHERRAFQRALTEYFFFLNSIKPLYHIAKGVWDIF
jgi:hypothetical protein